jgi:serine/threonine-protein kinase
LSNLAGTFVERKQYARAVELYHQAIQVFSETLPADHLNMGIAQIKLGRALLRQSQYSEAETHILSGYAILSKQANPSVSFLQKARQDLISVYDALREPEKAQKYRAELAAADSKLAASR